MMVDHCFQNKHKVVIYWWEYANKLCVHAYMYVYTSVLGSIADEESSDSAADTLACCCVRTGYQYSD